MAQIHATITRKKSTQVLNLEINPTFHVRTNNVKMYFDNYDDGLDIIGIECTGMDVVSSKSSNYFQIIILCSNISYLRMRSQKQLHH